MLPLLPILGGLGLLYLITRSSEGPKVSLDRAYGAVEVQAQGPATPIQPGQSYAIVLRFIDGTTPAGRGDVFVEARSTVVEPGGLVAEFVIEKLLERFTPRQKNEPDLASLLRAGQRPAINAAQSQVTRI
jgi:hypothetical protein